MTESGPRILVVDDEKSIRSFLRTSLRANGFTVFEASCGKEALENAAQQRPDAIILDLGLPDIEGFEVTRRLREWTNVPILVLSVRDREDDKVRALDEGADGYVTKPFAMGELLARIRAALRRAAHPEGRNVFEREGFQVDLTRRIATRGDSEIALTPTEYDLLKELIRNAGRVLTHAHLLRTVWGRGNEDELHLLRVNMSNLRRKIEVDPSRPALIVTEPGVGYRLRE